MKDVSFLQHKINNAGFFLQTINVIIIAKQPVLIQLKVFIIKTTHFAPRGRQNKTFPFVNFQLVRIHFISQLTGKAANMSASVSSGSGIQQWKRRSAP